ncbi:putative uncharacterized protein DDB_G0286901 [Papilio machaon]|uniref:putative uncharacterized protein DDB_G0286901 n=1 Tax=Papilio machaon TaxID=76193 RepID=UPI001E665E2A|nr:putative uncharacterized protein DDB_G0286901 [Papilio machaon]
MLCIAVFLILPTLVICSSEGNIHLLEEEISEAIKACTNNENEQSYVKRYTRSNRNTSNQYQYNRIENNMNSNPYHHERRNTNTIQDMMTPNNVSTISDNDLMAYDDKYENENFNNTGRNNFGNFYGNVNNTFQRRNKRNDHYLNKNEDDQCLSHCVFANLRVVDSRGIPRETELWNKIQADVTSQQSRILMQNQIRSCFQELQSESEGNGCSYSNKLERCLMLHISDRIRSNSKKQS